MPAAIREQVFGWLTEAYFHLSNWEMAWFCAEHALEINPLNCYVLEYLEEMPPGR